MVMCAQAAKEAANAKKAQQPSFGRAVKGPDGTATRKQLLNPVRLVSDLEQVLSDKSILIGDGGDFIATAAYVPAACVGWLPLLPRPHLEPPAAMRLRAWQQLRPSSAWPTDLARPWSLRHTRCV